MTQDEKLCEQINLTLPETWEPFSPLGDGVSVQGYLKAGWYGVIGSGDLFRVVHAEDGLPVTPRGFNLEDAMRKAEKR